MIVFGLLARKRCRQKSPGSRKGEICQPRHALCWCVLWRIRKTAFHSRQCNSKWQTFPWKSVTQTNWRLQVSCAIWFHIPAGHSACSHGKAGSKLDCRQLQQWLHRKIRMATELIRPQASWLSCLRSYAWTQQDISTQPKYHRQAEESLAVHMGWSATELYQQGHTEHPQKTSSLCESWGRKLWTRLEINCFHSFELVASDVFFWFQYKHYDENCDLHRQNVLHGSVVA